MWVLWGILSLLWKLSSQQQTFRNTIKADGIYPGERFWLQLQKVKDNIKYWPDFSDLKTQNLITTTSAVSSHCFLFKDSYKVLSYLTNQPTGEIFTLIYHPLNNSFAVYELDQYSGGLKIIPTTMKQCRESMAIVYSRLYYAGAKAPPAYRVYYFRTNLNSNLLRYYDSLAGSDDTSLFQTTANWTKIEPVSFITEKRAYLAFKPKEVGGEDPALLHTIMAIDLTLTLVNGFPSKITETVYKIGDVMKSTGAIGTYRLQHWNVFYTPVQVGKDQVDAQVAVFGGEYINKTVGEQRKHLLYACIISKDNKITRCSDFISKDLAQGEYFLKTGYPVSTDAGFGASAIYIKKTADKLFTSERIEALFHLTDSVRKTSLGSHYPPTLRERPESRGPHVVVFIPEGAGASYMEHTVPRLNEEGIVNYYNPSIGTVLMLTEPSADGVVVGNRDCLERYTEKSVHHIEIDTASYASGKVLKLGFFSKQPRVEPKRVEDSLTIITDKTLPDVKRTDIEVQRTVVPSEYPGQIDINPLFSTGALTKITTSAKDVETLNVNEIVYMYREKAIESTLIAGTFDRAVDLQNGYFYYNCDEVFEGGKYVARCSMRTALPIGETSKLSNIKIAGEWTVVLMSCPAGKRWSIITINTILTPMVSLYALPEETKQHNYVITGDLLTILFIDKQSDLWSRIYNIYTRKELLSTFHNTPKVLSITHSERLEGQQFHVLTDSGVTYFDFPTSSAQVASRPPKPSNMVQRPRDTNVIWRHACVTSQGSIVASTNDGTLVWFPVNDNGYLFPIKVKMNMGRMVVKIFCEEIVGTLFMKSNNDFFTIDVNKSFSFKRYINRRIYNAPHSGDLLFSHGDRYFTVGAYNNGSIGSAAMNPVGTSFVSSNFGTSFDANFVGTDFKTAFTVNFPLTKTQSAKPNEFSISESSTYSKKSSGRYDFDIILDSKKDYRDHIWGFELGSPTTGENVRVNNRFTYSSTIEIEGFKAIDYYFKGNFRAFIVKNQTHYLILASTSKVNEYEKIALREISQVMRAPRIVAGTNASDTSKSSWRVTVWYTFDQSSQVTETYSFESGTVKMIEDSFFDVQFQQNVVKGDGIGDGENFVYASFDQGRNYFRPWGAFQNKQLQSSLNSAAKPDNVYEFSVAGNKEWFIIVKQDKFGNLDIGCANVRTSSKMFYKSFDKETWSKGLFSKIACKPSPMSQNAFYCIFAGDSIYSYTVETTDNDIVLRRLAEHKRYKNLEAREILLGNDLDYFLLAGVRRGSSDRDSAGILYYPLRGENLSGYFLGGMDKLAMQRHGVSINDRLTTCPRGFLLVIKDNSWIKTFRISTPMVQGRL